MGTFFKLQVYETLGISQVKEIYYGVWKDPKGLQIHFMMAVKKTRKQLVLLSIHFLGQCIYSSEKDTKL